MVAVGITKPYKGPLDLWGHTDYIKGMTACLNIVLAYSGHVTYFGFASELKDPRDYTKSLIMLQSTAVTVYTIVAVVIYSYVGPDVPAPAISAASQTVRKAAYGVAVPTIIVGGVVNASVGSKQIYLRFWTWKGQPKVVQEKTWRSKLSWIATVVLLWSVAWIIAESIPTFEYVLALVAALLSGWYSCECSTSLSDRPGPRAPDI